VCLLTLQAEGPIGINGDPLVFMKERIFVRYRGNRHQCELSVD
jgi:hypothetical protein